MYMKVDILSIATLMPLKLEKFDVLQVRGLFGPIIADHRYLQLQSETKTIQGKPRISKLPSGMASLNVLRCPRVCTRYLD